MRVHQCGTYPTDRTQKPSELRGACGANSAHLGRTACANGVGLILLTDLLSTTSVATDQTVRVVGRQLLLHPLCMRSISFFAHRVYVRGAIC